MASDVDVYLAVFNPSLSQGDESRLHETLLYFYPETVPLDDQLFRVGLCVALFGVMERFGGNGLDIVHFERRCIAVIRPTTDLWLMVEATNADATLVQLLLSRAYEAFDVMHGTTTIGKVKFSLFFNRVATLLRAVLAPPEGGSLPWYVCDGMVGLPVTLRPAPGGFLALSTMCQQHMQMFQNEDGLDWTSAVVVVMSVGGGECRVLWSSASTPLTAAVVFDLTLRYIQNGAHHENTAVAINDVGKRYAGLAHFNDVAGVVLLTPIEISTTAVADTVAAALLGAVTTLMAATGGTPPQPRVSLVALQNGVLYGHPLFAMPRWAQATLTHYIRGAIRNKNHPHGLFVSLDAESHIYIATRGGRIIAAIFTDRDVSWCLQTAARLEEFAR